MTTNVERIARKGDITKWFRTRCKELRMNPDKELFWVVLQGFVNAHWITSEKATRLYNNFK